MRIGVDARELQGHPTGTGRYLRNLLQAWPAGDLFVLYFKGAAPPDAARARAGLEIRALEAGGRGFVWQERTLPAAARADRLDVFWAPSYFCPLRLSLPRVTSVHDLSFFSRPDDFPLWEGARRRWLVRHSVNASARVLTISDFTAREIAACFPTAAARTVAIPLAADADLPAAPARDEARRRLNVRGPMLLSVGSIFNRRRLPELLAAVRRVAPRWPSLVLVVVGDNRTSPPLDLAARVRDLGLESVVRLSGFVTDEELALRYAAADVAVYLSEYEGFGLPVIESMARGLPVLTSRRPATGELFAGAAMLCEPDDPREIAQGLHELLGEAGLREELARRGRARAAAASWPDIAVRTRAVLAAAAGS
jgi:glycosyltransferase involved in cell wall biosynthesis